MHLKKLFVGGSFSHLSVAGLLAVSLLPFTGHAATPDEKSSLVPIGQYTNIIQDSEHCAGYEVELWRSGDEIHGVFHVCPALVGDRKTAILEHPSYNAQTGRLPFETSLSLGSDYIGSGKQTPSKDHFIFSGRLGSNSITGTLSHSDSAYDTPITSKSPVRMRRNARDLPTYRTVGEWHSKITETEHPATLK